MALLSQITRVLLRISFTGPPSLDSRAAIAYNHGTMLWQRLAGPCVKRCALKAGVSRLVLSCLFAAVATLVLAGSATSQQAPPTDRDKLVQELVTLDSEVQTVSGRITDLQSKSVSLKKRIVALKAEAEAAKAELARKKVDLSLRARDMYINGRKCSLDLILSSENISDFMQRAQYQERLATGDSKMVSEITTESKKLASSLDELTARKSEIDSLAREAVARKDRMTGARQEKQQLLVRAGDEEQQVQAQASSVETKMKELNPPAAQPNPSRPQPAGPPTAGNKMTMVATMYCPLEPGLDDHTATGMKATRGVIAVDPRVIPLGTRMWVEGYGNGIAGDTGSAIKGNRIDLCVDTLEECNAYGKRTVQVVILD